MGTIKLLALTYMTDEVAPDLFHILSIRIERVEHKWGTIIYLPGLDED